MIEIKNDKLKPLSMWQSDSTTRSCTKCHKQFGYLLRKHHCRRCGYIFCYQCAAKMIEIPAYVKVPIPKSTIYAFMKTGGKSHRVCDICYHDISLLKQNKLIEIFNLIDFNIKDIKAMAQVCKDWNLYAKYYINTYRALQYELRPLNKLEVKILNSNINLITGHDIFVRQAIRYLNASFVIKKRYGCKNLLCSRNCGRFLNETFLILCDSGILAPEIHEYAIKNITHLERYLPYLLEQGIKSPFTTIIDYLFSQMDNINIANEIFWYLRVNIVTGELIYKSLLLRWEKECKYKDRIYAGEEFVKILETKKIGDIPTALKYSKIIIPTHIEIDGLIFDSLAYKKSASSPIVLTFKYDPEEQPNSYGSDIVYKKILRILYKPEDVRKDQCIMTIIHTIDDILTEELDDMFITKYKVLPISKRAGLIEIVEGETLYEIQKTDTLMNYIMSNNLEVSSRVIRQRFLRSAAAYSVITYMLTIGDRHPGNILITNEGYLIHIDYGFVMSDPKFIDEIRVSDDIIRALGKDYKEFQVLCTDKIFNTLRRHVHVIYQLLTVLTTVGINLELIQKTIYKKFIPGANKSQAKLALDTSMRKSSYTYKIVDILYASQQEGVINKINHSMKYIKSFFY